VRVWVRVSFRLMGSVSINDDNLGAGKLADMYQKIAAEGTSTFFFSEPIGISNVVRPYF